jgi:tetratricopeptide (TPR) repeat protein
MVQMALDLKNENNYAGAVKVLEELVGERPDSAVGQGLLGSYYYMFLHDGRKALPHLKIAVRLSPKKEKPSLALFHCLWSMDRVEEALEEIKRFQLLTNWACRDYLEIMKEINEKWGDEKEEARPAVRGSRAKSRRKRLSQ